MSGSTTVSFKLIASDRPLSSKSTIVSPIPIFSTNPLCPTSHFIPVNNAYVEDVELTPSQLIVKQVRSGEKTVVRILGAEDAYNAVIHVPLTHSPNRQHV